jgi:hypothetical protein
MPTPTTDFTIFDSIELINWDAFLTGDDPLHDVRAVRRPLTQSAQRNVERYVDLRATDVVFHVDATQFGDRRPLAADTISDASLMSYTVLFCEKQTIGNTYTIVARKIEEGEGA